MMKHWLTARRTRKYLRNGIMLQRKGNLKSAIEKLSKAIEMDPTLIDAYLARGIAYFYIGEMEHCIADLDIVLLNKPEVSAALYWRSRSYMELDKADLALVDIDQAIALDPNEPAGPLFRCFIHSSRDEYDAAIADATKAVELGMEKPGYQNRALTFTKMGKYQEAIEDWTKVIELEPGAAYAYCERGILLDKIGQAQRSISDLQIGLKHKDKIEERLRLSAGELLEKLQKSNSVDQGNPK